ncbi:MAG: hypothetical protein WCH62_06320 [Candidatus Omnitrophota bacterium]
MKCKNDGLYSKDDNKQLHFYCEYCGKEMECDEDRECQPTTNNLEGCKDVLSLVMAVSNQLK